MIFNIDPEELVHYIHGYTTFYDYDEYEGPSPWFFFRVDRGLCGVWFSGGYELVREGANTGKEIISRGLNHGVVIRAGSLREWGSFNSFRRALGESEVFYDGARELRFRDSQYGIFTLKAPETVSLNGKELEFPPAPEMLIERGVWKAAPNTPRAPS
jgi:hypothetical protein